MTVDGGPVKIVQEPFYSQTIKDLRYLLFRLTVTSIVVQRVQGDSGELPLVILFKSRRTAFHQTTILRIYFQPVK